MVDEKINTNRTLCFILHKLFLHSWKRSADTIRREKQVLIYCPRYVFLDSVVVSQNANSHRCQNDCKRPCIVNTHDHMGLTWDMRVTSICGGVKLTHLNKPTKCHFTIFVCTNPSSNLLICEIKEVFMEPWHLYLLAPGIYAQLHQVSPAFSSIITAQTWNFNQPFSSNYSFKTAPAESPLCM